MVPVGIQMYSLRKEAEKDFIGTLKRVAKIGYKGVELMSLFGHDPKDIKKLADDLGLKLVSMFFPAANPENVNEISEVATALELDYICCGGCKRENFNDLQQIKEETKRMKLAHETLASKGLTFLLHNHFWEFKQLDGKLAYEYLLAEIPELKLELDIYWASNYGVNKSEDMVRKFSNRAPILHIKDGLLEEGFVHTAVGKGRVDIKKSIEAADKDVVKWLIVELDNCSTDMLEAVEESYDYLVSNRLALGNSIKAEV